MTTPLPYKSSSVAPIDRNAILAFAVAIIGLLALFPAIHFATRAVSEDVALMVVIGLPLAYMLLTVLLAILPTGGAPSGTRLRYRRLRMAAVLIALLPGLGLAALIFVISRTP